MNSSAFLNKYASPRDLKSTKKTISPIHQFFHRSPAQSTHDRIVQNEFIEDIQSLSFPSINNFSRFRIRATVTMVDLLNKLLQNSIAEAVFISTYTLNAPALDTLINYVDAGRIKSLNLFIAESYSYRNGKHMAAITRMSLDRKDQISLAYGKTHANITLINIGENFYIIEGSMNWTTNKDYEQIIIDNDKTAFIADQEFLTSIITGKLDPAVKVIC